MGRYTGRGLIADYLSKPDVLRLRSDEIDVQLLREAAMAPLQATNRDFYAWDSSLPVCRSVKGAYGEGFDREDIDGEGFDREGACGESVDREGAYGEGAVNWGVDGEGTVSADQAAWNFELELRAADWLLGLASREEIEELFQLIGDSPSGWTLVRRVAEDLGILGVRLSLPTPCGVLHQNNIQLSDPLFGLFDIISTMPS